MTDLADVHNPITSLFECSESDQQLELTQEQASHFEEHGYVAGIEVFTSEQIDQLRTELDQVVQPGHEGESLWYEYHSNESDDPNHVLFHALGAWRLRDALHDCLWNRRMLVPASQLLGGAVRFWHDQLFCKPANHGGVVAWHQDYSYWTRTKPVAHLTCWIGLDDSTEENGCLQYIPGSHRWDLLPITGLAGDMDSIKEVLTDDQWEQMQNPVAIEMKQGQASFHHPFLVHGSKQNHSSRPRRAIVINMVRDGVTSASDEPLLKGVPAIELGVALGGKFFPLLYTP